MDETSLLASLNETSLRAMAEYYGGLARRCSAKAAQIANDRATRERNESRLDTFAGAAWVVENHMAAGMTPDQAMAAAAREIGAPVETIRRQMARHWKEQDAAERHRRDREIMLLAARGWTNARIAQRVGLHRSSVSRIVQRGLSTPAPEQHGATSPDELVALARAAE